VNSVPVEAHRHVADRRPNIPTRETSAFAADDGPPPFVVLRDRSLDPQLVWFDPTTGAVRSGDTDDIACWFIDTDYDGASLFVRQAYFLGANEP
jgi:hypothetical protein